MATRELPEDIVHEIIDHLNYGFSQKDTLSFRALLNCSLVSKSWVSRSRFHLFKDVSLGTLPSGNRLGNGIAFLELLNAPHTTIRQVQTLLVTGGEWVNSEHADLFAPLSRSVCSLIAILWRPVAFSQSLAINSEEDPVRGRLLEFASKLGRNLGGVAALTLYMSFAEPNDTIIIVDQFRHLQELTLIGSIRRNRDINDNGIKKPLGSTISLGSRNRFIGPPPTLRSIRIKYTPPMKTLIGWLERTRPSLQEFRALRLRSEDLASVTSFLRSVSQSLRVLTLDTGIINSYFTDHLGTRL